MQQTLLLLYCYLRYITLQVTDRNYFIRFELFGFVFTNRYIYIINCCQQSIGRLLLNCKILLKLKKKKMHRTFLFQQPSYNEIIYLI